MVASTLTPINVELLWVQPIMALPLNTHDCTPTRFPTADPNELDVSSDSEDNISVSTFDTSLASEVDSADLNSDSADSSTASDGSPDHDTILRAQLEVANKVRITFYIATFD